VGGIEAAGTVGFRGSVRRVLAWSRWFGGSRLRCRDEWGEGEQQTHEFFQVLVYAIEEEFDE
jgi:hypothetical protein